MAKSAKGRRRLVTRQPRFAPYPAPNRWEVTERESSPKAVEKKDWEDATCSVCMEYPHHAVLLLCSSHDKGCRPYMCGTSYRHSNCLDQFKKAYTKAMSEANPFSSLGWPTSERPEVMELACPLCRGQVKGCTVVEPARAYLDNKRRSCMQDNCPFVGTYRELRRHVRSEHPSAKPREVDSQLEHKWRMLEHDRERQDVISTIRSSMPGSVVLGDYVIDMNGSDSDTDFEGGGGGGGGRRRGISRSFLYFFLREGTRLMRQRRENGPREGREEDDGAYVPLVPDDGDAEVVSVYSSEGDDEEDVGPINGQWIGRRWRRRRRRD